MNQRDILWFCYVPLDILRSIFLNHILELELMNQEFILVAIINLGSPYLIWTGFKKHNHFFIFFISIFFFWFLMNLKKWLICFFDKLPQVFFYSECHSLVARHFSWFSSHFSMLSQVDHSWGNTSRDEKWSLWVVILRGGNGELSCCCFWMTKGASILPYFFSHCFWWGKIFLLPRGTRCSCSCSHYY